jgi:ribosomal protein S21
VTKVIVEPDESFESALKRFKKQCEKAGLLSEFKKRQHYESPAFGVSARPSPPARRPSGANGCPIAGTSPDGRRHSEPGSGAR